MIKGILDKRELSFWWSSDDNHLLMPLCIWWWEGFSPNGLFLFHRPWVSDAGHCRTHVLGPPPSFHSPLTQHTGHGHNKFHGCSWTMNTEIWQLVTVNYRQISKHYRCRMTPNRDCAHKHHNCLVVHKMPFQYHPMGSKVRSYRNKGIDRWWPRGLTKYKKSLMTM